MENEAMVSETNSFKLIPVGDRFAKVDPEDYEYLSQFNWLPNRANSKASCYAVRCRDGDKIRMHREVVGCPDGMVVDHKNHETLDNRKKNLRVCTGCENRRNSRPNKRSASKFKGVNRHGSNWRAEIKKTKLGTFKTQQEAAVAYDKAATELFGEFAWLNASHFPELEATS